MSDFLLYEDSYFRIEHSQECLIPGYVLLFSQAPIESVELLAPEALAALPLLMKKIYAALNAIVHPERIYCASFGEVLRTVHFHFFPRTDWIGDTFRQHHPEAATGSLNGPMLFEWARQFYKTQPLPKNTLSLAQTLDALRTSLNH